MDSLNHMLELYNSNLADNSAYNEAMKSANNWQGSINKLSNSWADLVQNFADSDVIIGVVNLVNGLVQALDKLGTVGTIGLGAGLFAGIKNFGRPKMFGLCFENAEYHKCSFGHGSFLMVSSEIHYGKRSITPE